MDEHLCPPEDVPDGLLTNLVEDQGFTIYLVHFDFHQGNMDLTALTLMEVLDDIWNLHTNHHRIKILGISLGGIVARNALQLAWNERNGDDLHVDKFISLDAPNSGATIPMSITAALQYFGNNGESKAINPTAQAYFRKIKTPAAQQLLLQLPEFNYQPNKNTGNTIIDDYYFQTNASQKFWLRDFNYTIATSPSLRKITVVAGGGESVRKPRVERGTLWIDYEAGIPWEVGPFSGSWEFVTMKTTLGEGDEGNVKSKVFVGNWDFIGLGYEKYEYFLKEPVFMPGVPGSQLPWYREIIKIVDKIEFNIGWTDYLTVSKKDLFGVDGGLFKTDGTDEIKNRNFGTFVPTWSALSFPGITVNDPTLYFIDFKVGIDDLKLMRLSWFNDAFLRPTHARHPKPDETEIGQIIAAIHKDHTPIIISTELKEFGEVFPLNRNIEINGILPLFQNNGRVSVFFGLRKIPISVNTMDFKGTSDVGFSSRLIHAIIPSDLEFGQWPIKVVMPCTDVTDPGCESNTVDVNIPPPGLIFVPGSGGFNFDYGKTGGDGNSCKISEDDILIDGFFISKAPITIGDFAALGSQIGLPPESKGLPLSATVTPVTFKDAAFYCNLLSLQHNLQEVYTMPTPLSAEPSYANGFRVNLSASGFRLPTEAQWEYAYKSGDADRLFWWDDDHPALSDVDEAFIHAFWQFGGNKYLTSPLLPDHRNDFGLFDMAGLVDEWVNDLWECAWTVNTTDNPTGPDPSLIENQNNSDHAVRGGSNFNSAVTDLDGVNRYIGPNAIPSHAGFRVVLPVVIFD